MDLNILNGPQRTRWFPGPGGRLARHHGRAGLPHRGRHQGDCDGLPELSSHHIHRPHLPRRARYYREMSTSADDVYVCPRLPGCNDLQLKSAELPQRVRGAVQPGAGGGAGDGGGYRAVRGASLARGVRLPQPNLPLTTTDCELASIFLCLLYKFDKPTTPTILSTILHKLSEQVGPYRMDNSTDLQLVILLANQCVDGKAEQTKFCNLLLSGREDVQTDPAIAEKFDQELFMNIIFLNLTCGLSCI